MARTILITAGTSILDNLRQQGIDDLYSVVNQLYRILPSREQMSELLNPPAAGWAGAGRRGGNNGTPGAWWIVDYYGRYSPKDQARIHAAELASLRLLNLTEEDKVIILCSDTHDGLFCGLVVAHLIKQRDDPIRFHSQPAADMQMDTREVDWGWEISDRNVPNRDMPRAGRGMVSMWQIPGLTPDSREVFEKTGAGNLVRTFVRLARQAAVEGRPFVVNFTGGYKATIPLLTLVASWMGSPAVTMVALYQDSKELLHIPTADSQPSESLWQQLRALKADPRVTLAEVETGRRRYFRDQPRPGGGLEWSLLGEALAIYFANEDSPPT